MYLLIIVLVVNGQFNSFTELNFQEFNSKLSCMAAEKVLLKLSRDAVGTISTKCVKK